MSNTSYTAISSLIPSIYQGAIFYAQQNFFMPNVVTVYNDRMGMEDRTVSKYSQGTVATGLSETADITSDQAFTPTSLATLSPAEIGTQYIVTDQRMATDYNNVMADLSEHIGYAVGKQVDSDLISNFSAFTAGTIDAGGSSLTWERLYKARSILAAANVPAPYTVVLHEFQWLSLATAANIAGLSNAGPLQIRNDIQSRYYVGSVGDMNIFTASNDTLTAGTAVIAGIFNRRALALDVRRALRLELERDASLRATEVVPTMIYAHGVWDASFGCQIISDASTPTA